jgi:hypothetical protein
MAALKLADPQTIYDVAVEADEDRAVAAVEVLSDKPLSFNS